MGEEVVPRVGIEPTLLAERYFESRASTNFATEARGMEGGILPHGACRLDSMASLPPRKPAHAAARSCHPGLAADQRRSVLHRLFPRTLVHRRAVAVADRAWLPAVAGG